MTGLIAAPSLLIPLQGVDFTGRSIEGKIFRRRPGELSLALPLPHTLGEAHYQLRLMLQRGAILLTRSIGINVMPAVTTAKTLTGRKLESLRYTTAQGMDRTCRLLAMLHLQEYGPQSESLLNSTLQRISARRDSRLPDHNFLAPDCDSGIRARTHR